MTTDHSWSVWSPSAKAALRSPVDLVSCPVAEALDPRLDVTVALRRCATYRKAFRGAAISYPAAILWMDPVADWVKRHGVNVDVTSVDELDLAAGKGISPSRLIMHRGDATARPIRLAVNAGVGRFVVDSGQQIAMLAITAQVPQRVLVDVSTQSADALAKEVMSRQRLDLIGLHCRVGEADQQTVGDIVGEMIAQMSLIRHKHGVILTRVSLAEVAAADPCDRSYLRGVAEGLDGAVDDACARYRYPRPALVLPTRRSALSPAG